MMSPNIHHLIDSVEYPFELWKNLEKAFGMKEVEDEAWSEPSISSCVVSQDVLASTFFDEVIYDEGFSHIVHVVATLFDSNASSFNEEANIEEQYFSVSLEDTDDEKEVTDGASIVNDDDSLTHSLFFMSSIIDYEIYVTDPSHFVHTSLIDGAQPSDFQDVFLAISIPISVFPLILLDLMFFYISSFVLGINT